MTIRKHGSGEVTERDDRGPLGGKLAEGGITRKASGEAPSGEDGWSEEDETGLTEESTRD